MKKRYLLIIPFIVCCVGCSDNTNIRISDTFKGSGIIADNGMVVSAHPQSSRLRVELKMAAGADKRGDNSACGY